MVMLLMLLSVGQWGRVMAESTDGSGTDNMIYIEPLTATQGSQAVISIRMKNTAAIRGFQFDLCLPEGVTAVKSETGKIQSELNASRLPEDDEHQLTFSEHEGGVVRFLCGSMYDETFTGNDGEIATLQVNIADDMAAGDYAVLLKDIKLTETDIAKFYITELLASTLTVAESFILGDANGDGVVDVADVVAIVNYILEKPGENFNIKAADVNGDNVIDAADVVGVVNIILGKG